MRRPLEIEQQLVVKSYDIDFAGIVSNIVYIRWLEDLRLKMLDAYLPLELQIQSGIGPVVMQTQVQYRIPLTLFDRPIARMWMQKLSKLKWHVAAEIFVGGKIVSTAEQYGAIVDLASRRPVPIPQALQTHYEKAVGELGGL